VEGRDLEGDRLLDGNEVGKLGRLPGCSSRFTKEGSIEIDATDYTRIAERDGEYVPVNIEDVDRVATRRTHLTFTLDYPFDRPYEGEIVGDAGITLRQIIDAVRHAYRIMYRGASHESMEHLDNMRVLGDYGQAFHAMKDLVIESIAVDEATGRLDLFIGS
jgi:hypothetical protein